MGVSAEVQVPAIESRFCTAIKAPACGPLQYLNPAVLSRTLSSPVRLV